MFNHLRSAVLAAGTVGLLLSGSLAAQGNKSLLVEGLQLPYKLLLTDAGNLLVTEAGGAPNTGRISRVSRSGNRVSLLEGLPSGPSNPEMTPIGPTGIVLRERMLFVAFGEGDAVRNGPTPGSLVLNPAGVSSPLFSSVVTFRFDEDADRIASPFVMTMVAQRMLADGHAVDLENEQGRRVHVELLTKFQGLQTDPRTVYRHSDPFGLAMGRRPETLYLVDSGQNTIAEIDASTGRWGVLTRFAPLPNPTPVGGPTIDYVPTAATVFGDELLVTNLSGFPFVPGLASVQSLNPRTGAASPWINGLTSTIDIGIRRMPQGPQVFVLSFSGNMRATPAALPGELWQFDSPAGKSIATFVTPTGMAVDSATGEVFVCELGTGRIYRVATQ
ncbi:MAG TPA: ScyD/ScyE family protein [Paludibaculum sp.]|jgi:hypothetical protein